MSSFSFLLFSFGNGVVLVEVTETSILTLVTTECLVITEVAGFICENGWIARVEYSSAIEGSGFIWETGIASVEIFLKLLNDLDCLDVQHMTFDFTELRFAVCWILTFE